MIYNYEKEKSLFDNDDEFGVQNYRQDSEYIFKANSFYVRLIKYNEKKAEDLSGDFLGLTAESSYPEDSYETIQMNLMSRAPTQQEITEFGYDGKAKVIYEGFVSWDTEISNKDIIEFIDNYGYNIKAGERYRITLDDTGIYQGQFTRKQFTLTKIESLSSSMHGDNAYIKNATSLFDNNDEFGLQEYRLDSNYVFNANKTPVKIIRYNEEKALNLSGDFLGTTIAATYPKDSYENIEINIMSSNIDEQEITEFGYDGKGIVSYDCFANWDVDIGSKDIIEFVSNYGLNIKAGERFRVILEDNGLYQGQFTRKQFSLRKISDTAQGIETYYIIDELDSFIIDELGNNIISA